MNQFVSPLESTAEEHVAARKPWRVVAVEAIGPLTVLGGIVWAIAQPYRIAFFYPARTNVYDWLVQPPLLVVLVGVVFALIVAPGLVEDVEADVRARGDAPPR